MGREEQMVSSGDWHDTLSAKAKPRKGFYLPEGKNNG
jgi:hypothetical protein